MVGVRGMCSMLVLGSSVSECVYLGGTGACFIFYSHLFWIMCVR